MLTTARKVLSRRAKEISPSLTLEITAKAKKMKDEGISVIGFGAGEPDFGTPQYIVDAAKEALDRGFTKYTPSAGTVELRKAIARKLEADNDITYAHNQIVVSTGGKQCLFNAIFAMVEPGDEVIIPAPFWLTYPELVKMAGAKPVFVPTLEQNGFKLTAEQLKGAITKHTKMLILNSPNNPTGAVYSKQELESLAKVIVENDIFCISDEIYEKLVYGGEEHVSIASLGADIYNRTVTVNGLSKSYAMTGWRVGYLAAPKMIADAVNSIQSHTTSNPNSIAQYASTAALSDPQGEGFLQRMREAYDERRRYMVERINAIEGVSCNEPKGAFYVFVNVSKLLGKSYKQFPIHDAIDLAQYMLDEGVAVVPGNAFGADDHIRLSYAISLEDIQEGLDRIERFVKLLK